MKCPTCENSEDGKCCRCGESIPLSDQSLEADPYQHDINDDDSLHLECERCRNESADEI